MIRASHVCTFWAKSLRSASQLLLALLAGAIIVACVPATAQAHVLESDGDVSAVLHMPPSDAPVANEVTSVNLAFASSDSTFDISDYVITVGVQRNGSEVTSAAVQAVSGSTRDGAATVTFPEPGAYRLLVNGTQQGGDDTFRLEYSVRATKGGDNLSVLSQAGWDFWIVSVGSLVVLTIVARYQLRQGGRYR